MNVSVQDKHVLRSLAERIKEISELPHQNERRNLWKKLNALRPERPMMLMDQLPWHELSHVSNKLKPLCADEFLRSEEIKMRRVIYLWENFKADMVVEPFWTVTKVIEGPGFENGSPNSFPGFVIKEDIALVDSANDIVSHRYHDQLANENDIKKIGGIHLEYNKILTETRIESLSYIFGDILPVKAIGHTLMFRVWDEISMLRGVTELLYDIADRPEFLHETMEKATNNMIAIKDQLTELHALDYAQPVIHCAGAYSFDLPSENFDFEKPEPKDAWTAGMAQIFSGVSAETHYEFDIQYANRFYKDFGYVNYGCCEPLDIKMSVVEKVENVRKISMSPWTDAAKGASLINGRYVFTSKPNPAYLAVNSFDIKSSLNEIKYILKCCKESSCPVELILKDVSTVQYKPERLVLWENEVMKMVQDYAL